MDAIIVSATVLAVRRPHDEAAASRLGAGARFEPGILDSVRGLSLTLPQTDEAARVISASESFPVSMEPSTENPPLSHAHAVALALQLML